MKFKEIREDQEPKKAKDSKPNKKPKKAKKPKFNWKETIIHGKDFVSAKGKQSKEKVKELQSTTFANTQILWRPYALMIADYFNWEYYRNMDFIQHKLKTFLNKEVLSQKDEKQLEVLISINELKYYIHDKDHPKTIDINLELITRDFFTRMPDKKIYDELIQESDSKYKHSISYLLKLYNLLISFVKENNTRVVFHKVVVDKEHKEQSEDNHPVVINEKVMKLIPVNNYLSNKYQKKVGNKYEN